MDSHEKSEIHKQATLNMIDFRKNHANSSSVLTQISSQYEKEIELNRSYMKLLFELLLTISKQEIATRGHREDASSENRGNFLEFVELMAKSNPIINKFKIDGSFKYTLPLHQNQMIKILSDRILKEISNDIQNCLCFSLLIDEGSDVNKSEHISVILRYVKVKKVKDEWMPEINERFIGFIRATRLDAESIFHYVTDYLEKKQIDISKLVGQCYDGAKVMSGHKSGLMKRVQEVVPSAIYTHCYAHRLNLVLIDSIENQNGMKFFFDMLQKIYVFICGSSVRLTEFKEFQEIYHCKKYTIKSLCETRWFCRADAIKSISHNYKPLLAYLIHIIENTNEIDASTALGILRQLVSKEFIFNLVVLNSLLHNINILSKCLQEETLNIIQAAKYMEKLKKHMDDSKTDSAIKLLFESFEDFMTIQAEFKEINEIILCRPTTRTNSKSLNDDKKKLLDIIQCFEDEIKLRFDDVNMDILNAIRACDPISDSFMDSDVLYPIFDHYNHFFHQFDIENECKVAKFILKNAEWPEKDNDKLIFVFSQLYEHRDQVPNLVNLYQITMTLPITTAECERTFSALKRIKTYLRNSSSDSRTSYLSIISVESDIATSIDLSACIDDFNCLHDRRLNL